MRKCVDAKDEDEPFVPPPRDQGREEGVGEGEKGQRFKGTKGQRDEG